MEERLVTVCTGYVIQRYVTGETGYSTYTCRVHPRVIVANDEDSSLNPVRSTQYPKLFLLIIPVTHVYKALHWNFQPIVKVPANYAL